MEKELDWSPTEMEKEWQKFVYFYDMDVTMTSCPIHQFQYSYKCPCGKAKFEADWKIAEEKDKIERARRRADLELLSRTEKCNFCENPPAIVSKHGVVCWDCYGEKEFALKNGMN